MAFYYGLVEKVRILSGLDPHVSFLHTDKLQKNIPGF